MCLKACYVFCMWPHNADKWMENQNQHVVNDFILSLSSNHVLMFLVHKLAKFTQLYQYIYVFVYMKVDFLTISLCIWYDGYFHIESITIESTETNTSSFDNTTMNFSYWAVRKTEQKKNQSIIWFLLKIRANSRNISGLCSIRAWFHLFHL